MSDWFIQKSGFSSDSVLGPLTSEQVIALFNRGEIKKKTPIASQQHTGNEWMMFGKTVLLKQAQDAIQRQNQKKEQAAAELKKQQEEETIQLQEVREQEQKQIVVADRQQPVATQSLPTVVQVAEEVPTSSQQFPTGQSTYHKAVSERFESSNSIFDLLDWKFEKYVTPLIIRFTWKVVVAAFLCALVYFVVGPEVWASVTVSSPDSTPGTEIRIPYWMFAVAVRVVLVLAMLQVLLWIRVILESMIVIFNIARGISNIERNTDSDQ